MVLLTLMRLLSKIVLALNGIVGETLLEESRWLMRTGTLSAELTREQNVSAALRLN